MPRIGLIRPIGASDFPNSTNPRFASTGRLRALQPDILELREQRNHDRLDNDEHVSEHVRRDGASENEPEACDADVSPRHLSFIETGRSQPSREVVLRLAQELAIPLRQRNTLLLAGGFAPEFGERSFDSPDFANVRHLIDRLLKAHEPYPALAVDRHWTIVAANSVVPKVMGGVSEALLRPPINALRLALHPEGAAPRIANFAEWRAHILERLHHQIETTGDETLVQLERELQDYPAPPGIEPWSKDDIRVLVPLRLRTRAGLLRLVSTTMVFGTPMDVTLSELAIEVFLPAYEEAAAAIRTLASE